MRAILAAASLAAVLSALPSTVSAQQSSLPYDPLALAVGVASGNPTGAPQPPMTANQAAQQAREGLEASRAAAAETLDKRGTGSVKKPPMDDVDRANALRKAWAASLPDEAAADEDVSSTYGGKGGKDSGAGWVIREPLTADEIRNCVYEHSPEMERQRIVHWQRDQKDVFESRKDSREVSDMFADELKQSVIYEQEQHYDCWDRIGPDYQSAMQRYAAVLPPVGDRSATTKAGYSSADKIKALREAEEARVSDRRMELYEKVMDARDRMRSEYEALRASGEPFRQTAAADELYAAEQAYVEYVWRNDRTSLEGYLAYEASNSISQDGPAVELTEYAGPQGQDQNAPADPYAKPPPLKGDLPEYDGPESQDQGPAAKPDRFDQPGPAGPLPRAKDTPARPSQKPRG